MKEGLLYVGTDDGLVQVTEDGGKTLAQDRDSSRACRTRRYVSRHRRRRSTTRTPSTPRSTITRTATSSPYLLKSTDRGQDLDVDRRRPAGARHGAGASPRITSIRTCCSPAPSSACSSRTTAARSGSSSRAGCRRSPCATSRSRSARTTSSSAPSAAAFYILDDYSPLREPRRRRRWRSRRPSSRSATALLYMPTRQYGVPRQGVPRRDVLHGRQPARSGRRSPTT